MSEPTQTAVTGRPVDIPEPNSTLAERAGKSRPPGADYDRQNSTLAERAGKERPEGADAQVYGGATLAERKAARGGHTKQVRTATNKSVGGKPPTVKAVLEAVGEDADLARDALEAEEATPRPRPSLVEALEAVILAADAGDDGAPGSD